MAYKNGNKIPGKIVFTDSLGHKVEDPTTPITQNHDIVVPITGLHIDQVIYAGPEDIYHQSTEYTFKVKNQGKNWFILDLETGKRGWFPGSALFGKLKETGKVILVPKNLDGSPDETHIIEKDVKDIAEIKLFDKLAVNPKHPGNTVIDPNRWYEVQLSIYHDVRYNIHYFVKGQSIKNSSLIYKGENNWKDKNLKLLSQTL